ncbi:MAG: bifunctional 4-hydroxy-2-oxoglutarate aldolase/2-dehydro-3-deoxy-phosphogluconate aldolase [Clostridia bacterium]|nr:bifunctional 4-hydroxy-2-oxoglutarate aldolase/2-dehydro-3-deoxy-phosphogluconate aldolase [Clostridia bacterium]
MREQVISEIIREKLILIIRGYSGKTLLNILEAAFSAGVRLAEITFNAQGDPSDEATAAEIASAVTAFRGRMHIGAGTVLRPDQVELTYKAGGEFIISPDTDEKVIGKTLELGLVSVPGAFTPTEVSVASKAGADFVKLFPAGRLGPGYLKDISAPLSHINFLAVGGINAGNVSEYVSAGACGFGVGGSILDKKLIAAGDFDTLTENIARLVTSVHAAYSPEIL